MKPLILIMFAMLLAPTVALADDGLPDAFDDDLAPNFALVDAASFNEISARLDALEAEVDTKVTADEARAIAIEEIEKVMVTLRGSDGQVKQQAVQMNPGPDPVPNAAPQKCSGPNCQCADCKGPECDGEQCSTGSLSVHPGEQIIGYTDPQTGRYVDLTRQNTQQNCTTTYDAQGHAVTTCNTGNVRLMQRQPAVRSQPTQAQFQIRRGPIRRLFRR